MRSRVEALLTVATAAALLAAACWIGVRGCEHPAGPPLEPSHAAAATHDPSERVGEQVVGQVVGRDPTAPPAEPGRRYSPPSSRVAAPHSGPTRVFGCVRWGGQPRPLVAISFERVADPPREAEDWDLTDPSGRYEVNLSPARYAVLHEDDAWIATVEIPPGQRELRLDLFVP